MCRHYLAFELKTSSFIRLEGLTAALGISATLFPRRFAARSVYPAEQNSITRITFK